MRNAAMILAIIGGIIGMIVGFFGYGFAVLGEMFDEFTQAAREVGVDEVVDDPLTTKLIGLGAPIVAIAGGAMAPSRPAIAALLILASTVAMYYGFDFNVFTMFPIGMCGLAAVLAVLGAVLPPKEAHH
ncbi:MAG: hypothetical protein AAF666_10230 [Pseudomonadota bacterium]